MQLLSAWILMGYKLGCNNSEKYVTCSNGIYYFIRLVPTDLSDQYRSNKIKLEEKKYVRLRGQDDGDDMTMESILAHFDEYGDIYGRG